MAKKIGLLFSAVFTSLSIASISQVIIEKSVSSVEFLAIGKPSALKIKGELAKEPGVASGNLKVEEKGGQFQISGKASVKLNAFDTGIQLRNEHMKNKYLETAKFPEAEIVLTPVTLKENFSKENVEENEVPFKAQLTLHGVTKPIEGKTSLKKSGNDFAASFDFQFQISDFAIAVPEWLGITVSKEVRVAVSLKGALAQ